MIVPYLKVAFRNLWKYKTQSFTSILGLTFGIACFVPALYWLRYETSYDRFYPEAKRIYRIYSVDKQSGEVSEYVSGILGRKLQERFPAMQNATVFFVESNDCKTKEMPQIENITDAYFTPQHDISPFNMSANVDWPGKSPDEKSVFYFISTDSRFAETFQINILEGKWFDESEEQSIVLNEEAVRLMGLREPIGAVISRSVNYNMQKFRVVGVVKDFHTLSFRSRIPPTIFMKLQSPGNRLYVRVVPNQELTAIQRMTAILPRIDPTFAEVHPILLDDMYNRLNYSEQTGVKIFFVLAMVCLLISLFGIYAVTLGSTRRRRKEIAIRKVAGVEAGDIAYLFFCEYILQVIIAGIFALPLAYLAMSRWIQGYAYRTNIPWWLLAGVVLGVITMVLFTVLRQVLKVARSNPAEEIKKGDK